MFREGLMGRNVIGEESQCVGSKNILGPQLAEDLEEMMVKGSRVLGGNQHSCITLE